MMYEQMTLVTALPEVLQSEGTFATIDAPKNDIWENETKAAMTIFAVLPPSGAFPMWTKKWHSATGIDTITDFSDNEKKKQKQLIPWRQYRWLSLRLQIKEAAIRAARGPLGQTSRSN